MKTLIALVLLFAGLPAQAAQLYRWVDDQGRVEWRDTPPPDTARKVETRKIQGNVIPTSEAPYGVRQAVRNFPVTLWTTACGELCDAAKQHLARRAIPYTEKDPSQKDIEEFRKIAGAQGVPVLVVGRTVIKGYGAEPYDEALDAAGYPPAKTK